MKVEFVENIYSERDLKIRPEYVTGERKHECEVGEKYLQDLPAHNTHSLA